MKSKTDHNPTLQWRLDQKLEGAYYVKYGTGDIDWKKISESMALALASVGGVMLPPMLAGPDYTGRLTQVYV